MAIVANHDRPCALGSFAKPSFGSLSQRPAGASFVIHDRGAKKWLCHAQAVLLQNQCDQTKTHIKVQSPKSHISHKQELVGKVPTLQLLACSSPRRVGSQPTLLIRQNLGVTSKRPT